MLLLVQQPPMDRAIQISGKKLAALRKRRYMTQAEFSAALGIGASRVAQIEAEDEVGIYLKNFRKLATALGMTADALLAEVGTGSDTVYVPLPRAVYDSIAERAAHEGHPDVPSWLAKVAVSHVFQIVLPEPQAGADRLNSPPRLPAPSGTTPAPRHRKSR